MICVAPGLGAREKTAAVFFATGPLGNLRGDPVDLRDPWTVARLFAYFGENSRSRSALERLSVGTPDLRAERFEARLLTEAGLYERADSLLALQPHIRDSRAYYLHYLQRARLNSLAGRYDRALELIDRLDGIEIEEFEPYRDLLSIEALLQISRPLDACDIANKRFAKGTPRSLSPVFEGDLFEAYLDGGKLLDAVALVDSLKARKSDKFRFAPVIVREVEIRFMLADTLGAVRAAADLARSYGASVVAAVVDSVVGRVAPAKLESEVLLDFAGVYIAKGRAADAERLLGILRDRALEERERERRRLLLSEVLFKGKRFSAARQELDRRFDDPSLERGAMLLRARIYRALGHRPQSAAAYEAFGTEFPYDPKAPEALYVAWDLQREEGESKKASALLDRIVKTYPNNRYSHLATRTIASEFVYRNAYSRAAKVLESALEHWGRDDMGALYYLSQIYGKMGNRQMKEKIMEEIASSNPVSFYIDPGVSTDCVIPEITSVAVESDSGVGEFLGFLKTVLEERERAQEKVRGELGGWKGPEFLDGLDAYPYLTRGRTFLEMGFRDWGEAELRTVETASGLSPRAHLELGALFDDFAMPWRSVRSFQRAYFSIEKSDRKRLDREFKLLMYPTPFPAAVLENCARFGLPPHLVYAMIREESRFDEKAVSGAGAVGLMQVMPQTGAELAEELGLPEVTHENLVSPEINLRFGVSYASDLLEASAGDVLMMLAAYNAGLTNAKRWFTGDASKLSPVERVDDIDYWETCDYVKRIVESAHIYHDTYFSRK